LKQLGRIAQARIAFDRAIALAHSAAEAAHIRRQIDKMQEDAGRSVVK
jgi:RNA polymerase sigma-70 factor (ECF subfamily)